MANFRRGNSHIKAAFERSARSPEFAPMLTWKAGEEKLIQFITPLEEVPSILYHAFMRVSVNEYGKPVYRSFISRKDPGVDGEAGYDPIMERFGLMPKTRCVAVAAELDKVVEKQGNKRVTTGYQVKYREDKDKDGNTVEVPSLALIIQSPKTFFGYLSTFSDHVSVDSKIFAVTRRGGDQNTAYDFIPVADAIDLSEHEEHVPDLDAFLEAMSAEERVHKYIDKLPDDWTLDVWAEKRAAAQGKPQTTTHVESSSSTVETPAPAARRSSRFAALRAEVEAEKSA